MTKKELSQHAYRQTLTCRSVFFFFFAFIPDSLVSFGWTVTRLSVQRTEQRKYLHACSAVMQQHEKWLVLAILAHVSYVLYPGGSRADQSTVVSNGTLVSHQIRSDQLRGQRNAFWFHPARHRPLPRWQLAAGSLPLQAHSHRSPCGCPAPLDRARLRSVSATGGSLALLGLWVPALFLFASLA